jgi:predicted ATPase
MLKRLQVRDFKSLRELEVEFGRLTVLVGANGCGKSSVLQAIKLVRDLALAEWTREPPRFPAEAISRPLGPADTPAAVRMWLHFVPHLEVETNLLPLAGERVFLDSDRSFLKCTTADSTFEKRWNTPGVPDWVHTAFGKTNLYRLDSEIMQQAAYSTEATPLLGTRGENLAAVLDALQGAHHEQFEAIEAALRQFIAGLKRVRLRRVTLPVVRTVLVGREFRNVDDTAIGHQVMFDFEFARSVSAEQASEGTILLLGLLTAIGAEPGPPMTVMLDDLDRALHPKAQGQLVAHLHELLDQRPELQIIATSHSPYLVEHLAYEEVLAMTQSPIDGRSLIAPLTNHPDAERWHDEMSAGEFWSNVGEAWIHRAEAQ